MDTPESMKAELAAWNNGDGIDLETWISSEGKFSLAVGYASIFWPAFTLFEGYILPDGVTETVVRGWERAGRSRKSIEWVLNHLHIADIQHGGCQDISKDKLLVLGNVLKEIYEASFNGNSQMVRVRLSFSYLTTPTTSRNIRSPFGKNATKLLSDRQT